MGDAHFKPAWWLPGSHSQTLWPTLIARGRKKLLLRRERIELSDGDFFDVDWCGQGDGPIVLILHGLEGSIKSAYAKGMLQALWHQGWRGAFMHFRSCSGELNRLQRFYHSGDTQDLAVLVNILHEREPKTPLAAIGFSIGGNVLLKWLGEVGEQRFLKAAAAVSVPFELHKAVDRLRQGFSQVYERHFLRSLRKKVMKKFHQPLMSLRTLREFDEKVTAPLHGFCNVEDYYQQSSSRQFLKLITVPTLLLQAQDDPFMTPDMIPVSEELSSAITLEMTQAGGHVGFVAGKFPWRPQYWLEQRIPAFLMQHLRE